MIKTTILSTFWAVFAALIAGLAQANQPITNSHVRVTPEGSVYDSRTYMYDADRGRVRLRPEFRGMSTQQRLATIRPKTDEQVWYRGNRKLNLGGGRWVTPNQLASLRQRESKLTEQHAYRPSRKTTSVASYSSSPSTARHYQSRKLQYLITGATVSIHTSEGSGSGVITAIGRQKFVLTANHVIKGASYARLTSLKDSSHGIVSRTAGWHDKYDIAAIPLPRTLWHLPAVPLFNGQPAVGHPVYLSGFPKGSYRLTAGRVAGYTKGGTEMLHTAYSEGGASGGMLLTPNGYLCGIHTGVYLSGSSLSGYRIATPSSLVIQLVRMYGR
jgi:S1-C subfamily serine protease